MARHRKTYTGERRTVHLGVQLTPTERCVCRKLDSAILMVKAAKDRS